MLVNIMCIYYKIITIYLLEILCLIIFLMMRCAIKSFGGQCYGQSLMLWV